MIAGCSCCPCQRHVCQRQSCIVCNPLELLDCLKFGFILSVEVVGVGLPRLPSGAGSVRRYFPVSQPPDSGLQTSVPMPWRRTVGRTSRSIPRQRIEYGGCSVCGPIPPVRSAAQCASTRSSAGKVDVPQARILPARTRSVSAPTVSSIATVGSGR